MANAAAEVDATVGGGSGNTSSERHSTIGGGSMNKSGGFASSVAGGVYNKASAIQSLHDAVKEKDRVIESHEKRIHEMELDLAAQKRLMAELEAHFQEAKASAE